MSNTGFQNIGTKAWNSYLVGWNQVGIINYKPHVMSCTSRHAISLGFTNAVAPYLPTVTLNTYFTILIHIL